MTQVFESRWGFHPCSREVSKKLRFLNGFYQKALARFSAWNRWNAKMPHNRIKKAKLRGADGRVYGYGEPVEWKEPVLLPIFTQQLTRTAHVTPEGKYVKEGFEQKYWAVSDLGIPALAKQSRIPVANKEDVKPLSMSAEQIEVLYQEAQAWLKN